MYTEEKAGSSLPGSASGQQLAKNSEPKLIKAYFGKILELTNTGSEFPVSLDDVWPLAYGRKQEAVKTLKKDFVQNIDYQVLRQNAQNLKGGRPTAEYWLSTPCLEYFIAKRVKPVFEVYRKVFHQSVGQGPQLSEKASAYQEEALITVAMGSQPNEIWVKGGVIFAKMNRTLRYIGIDGADARLHTERVGRQHFIKVPVRKQTLWFMSKQGLDSVLLSTNLELSTKLINNVCKDVYGVEDERYKVPPFQYMYTAEDMAAILEELVAVPIKKGELGRLLKAGKQEGGTS